jgi:hypothetical protein
VSFADLNQDPPRDGQERKAIAVEGAAQKASQASFVAAVFEPIDSLDAKTHYEEIARNLLERSDSSAWLKRFGLARKAARRAASAGDFAEARQMYLTALAAAQRCSTNTTAMACDLLIELGTVEKQAGSIVAARETLRSAAELAGQLGDGRRITAIVRCLPSCLWPLPCAPDSLAVILAERALSLLAKEDHNCRASASSRLAAELSCLAEERERSERLIADALDIVRAGSDRARLVEVLRYRDCILRSPDRINERLANAVEVVRIAAEAGDYFSLYVGAIARAASLLELSEVDQAAAETETVAQAAAMSRDSACQAGAFAYRAGRAFMTGRFGEGTKALQSSRALLQEGQLQHLEDLGWLIELLWLTETDQLDRVERLAREVAARRTDEPIYLALPAWLDWRLGKTSEARLRIECLTRNDCAKLRGRESSIAALCLLGEVVSGLREQALARRLYDMLLPYAERHAVVGATVSLGAIARYLGLLAGALDNFADAARHLEDAMHLNLKAGARPWFAYSACDLAKVLAARNEAGDTDRARALLKTVGNEAAELQMACLANAVRSFAARFEQGTTDTNPDDQNRLLDGNNSGATTNQEPFAPKADVNGKGTSSKSTGDGTAMEMASLHSSGSQALALSRRIFRREGDFWAIGFPESLMYLRHTKGLALIAILLRHPGREFYCSDLLGMIDQAPGGQSDERANQMSFAGEINESDSGPMLDEIAKRSYRGRIEELRDQLDDARSFNDIARASNLEEEMAVLTRELARAVGLYGRDRKSGSRAERDRLRVTNSIKYALPGILRVHPQIGIHLQRAIRTGRFCSYAVQKYEALDWLL